MIRPFHYAPPDQRIAFGNGILAEVAEEVDRFGPGFVVASGDRGGLATRVATLAGVAEGARFFGAAQHTPVGITDQALGLLEAAGPSFIISVGGGSATGLGKALALRSGLPLVAVPTTYAGSEMTSILGQTEGGRKWTQRAEVVRPRSVVYDVALTCSLPSRVSAASGCNALAHAVEALWARDATPIHLLLAEQAIGLLTGCLPRVVASPGSVVDRTDALYGAFLAGTCLGACEMALHHRICHVLGGRFDLPHAETHAIVLPHVVAYYGASEAADQLGRALGVAPGDAGSTLFDLVGRLGLPQGLVEVGLPDGGVEVAADLLVEAGGWSPRAIRREAMVELVGRAARGERPGGLAAS